MKADYRTDAQKVLDLREREGLGMDVAKRIVKRDSLRKQICDIEDLGDVRRFLLEAFPSLGDV